ncbi:hypothetical protein HKD37_20G055210 [Glycine soja]
MKVELPTFEGSDPLGWVARAERFFKVQQIKPTEKLRLAFISMEGKAKSKNPSWDKFATALCEDPYGTVHDNIWISDVFHKPSVSSMKNLYSLAIVYSCFFFYEMILTCLHVATIWRTLLVMLAVWILKMFWIVCYEPYSFYFHCL